MFAPKEEVCKRCRGRRPVRRWRTGKFSFKRSKSDILTKEIQARENNRMSTASQRVAGTRLSVRTLSLGYGSIMPSFS
jgi:hypothetical protein